MGPSGTDQEWRGDVPASGGADVCCFPLDLQRRPAGGLSRPGLVSPLDEKQWRGGDSQTWKLQNLRAPEQFPRVLGPFLRMLCKNTRTLVFSFLEGAHAG